MRLVPTIADIAPHRYGVSAAEMWHRHELRMRRLAGGMVFSTGPEPPPGFVYMPPDYKPEPAPLSFVDGRVELVPLVKAEQARQVLRDSLADAAAGKRPSDDPASVSGDNPRQEDHMEHQESMSDAARLRRLEEAVGRIERQVFPLQVVEQRLNDQAGQDRRAQEAMDMQSDMGPAERLVAKHFDGFGRSTGKTVIVDEPSSPLDIALGSLLEMVDEVAELAESMEHRLAPVLGDTVPMPGAQPEAAGTPSSVLNMVNIATSRLRSTHEHLMSLRTRLII